jgi:hypothetical protein
MKTFPDEFADLLTPFGLRVLHGQVQAASCLFNGTRNYFATFDKIVEKKKANHCIRILNEYIYDLLSVEQSRIPRASIWEMSDNYSETLSKTMRKPPSGSGCCE